MTRTSIKQREALQRAREARRTREAALHGDGSGEDASSRAPVEPGERRRAAKTCGWCGAPMEPKAKGRIPKWCSPSCRQRAWEQSRAATSGLSAVRIVERRVEVRAPAPAPAPPTRRDWPGMLHDLAGQLNDGRIYDRDLPELAVALNAVLEAYSRRPYVRRPATSSPR